MTVNPISRPGPKDQASRWPSPPDPGDLSKRIAQRRAELHLTQAQAAARAGLSLRYLEYVQRYPARPNPATLRRLAAALRTTPAALLGGGADTPPGHGHPAELHRLQEDAAVWPWPGGEREVYVRIIPREITGRRVEIC